MIEVIQKPFAYYLRFNWNKAIIDDIKAIKPWQDRSYVPEEKMWSVSIERKNEVLQIIEKHGGKLIEQTESEKIGDIPPMPELDIEIATKIELRHYQKQGVAYGLEKKRFINGDKPGLGKQNPLYSLIATPNGFVKMGDLIIGQPLFGCDGNIYNVTGIFPQGVMDIYEVEFNDGSISCCGLEHLWKIRDHNRRSRNQGWIVRPLSFILKWGVLSKRSKKREDSGRKPTLKWEIPVCDPVKYNEKEYLIHPYLLGVMLGDGSLGRGITISIPDSEIETLDRITNLIPEYMKFTQNRSGACPNYRLVQKVTTKNNPFIREVQKLKLNVHGKDKFIPEIYLQGSVEQRMDLLRGLMDSDGSAKKNRITFHSKSKSLVDSVVMLVNSLGGQAIVRPYDRTHQNKGIEYQLNVRVKFIPFYLKRKAAQYDIKKVNYCSRYIKEVRYKAKEECQCISVSAPDNLYLTDHYIVTHNTAEAIATIFAAQAFPVLCIVPASLRDNWVKEWNKVVGIKAMILEDRVKKTWPTFYTVGMCNVFITSYDSLEKYFVEKINKDEKGKWKISNVVFNKNKDIFKAVIMDESHKCFPYDTNIQTNKGIYKIGDIVENKMKDLHVQSFSLSNNCLSYKPILNFWKNELRDRKIYTIRFYGGELQATQDHKIFTASGRYKKVSEIKSGEILFILRKEFLSSKKWKNDSSTTKTMGSLRITKGIFGVCNKYSTGKKNVYLRSKSLQGGHRNRNTKTGNRSRWGHTQYEEMEILRRTKNRNIKCVRVESVEIQKPTNNGKFRTGINGYKTVYDLEIAENNNYFANGILVSNCKDSKTRAAKLTAGICFQKEYRIALSGTPILNTPKDLVSQLKTIGQLEAVGGSYKYFINRYCGGDGKGATNLKELNYRLKTACFFQRTTEEVLTELPPKIYQNIYCDITTRKEYNIALNDLSSYLKDFKDKTAREISISMRGEVMVKIGILKQISARGKMEAVTEYIEDLLGAGEKVGLFVHHAEVADFIKGKFPQTLLYTGRQSSAEKNMAVEQFQKCKSCGVMFEDHKGLDHEHEMSDKRLITISTKAGGVGLTLTAARNMGVVELPWHPADCEQIEARFWRMSQTNNVKCTYFLGRNTIDEHIYDIIERKRGVVNAVMGLDDNRQFVDKEEKNLVDNIIKLFNDGKMNVVQ